MTVFGLIGPTASGKTALALELAHTAPIEIISVDSALIYKDMNIGTAKPTFQERKGVPHHLIDLCDPTDRYSAGQFVRDAQQCIQNIQARGKIPLLVGGTMLYFKALRDGLAHFPEVSEAIRAEWNMKMKTEGPKALYALLQQIDPLWAKQIQPTDTQRIQRGLEVFYASGQPLSTFHERQKKGLQQAIQLFGIGLADRESLHQRMALRVDEMLKQGLIEEVRYLQKTYPLTADHPAMRAVGYRQVWEALEQNTFSLSDLRERILIATRQYGKRQLTWLKNWSDLDPFEWKGWYAKLNGVVK